MAFLLLEACALLWISLSDLRTRRIGNAGLLLFTGLRALEALLSKGFPEAPFWLLLARPSESTPEIFAGILLKSAVLLGLFLAAAFLGTPGKRTLLGGGDLRLAAALLFFEPAEPALPGLLFSALSALVPAAVLRKRGGTLPFAPFLAGGWLLARLATKLF